MCAAKLSIPKQESACDLGIAQNAEQLQQWLDSLPVADVENSALMVLQLLGMTNRCELQLDFRLRLMRNLNPLVDHLVSSLRSKYSVGESPYSSPKNIKRIGVVKKLLQEMGFGFKILITKLYAMEEQAVRADLASSIFHTMRLNASR